MPYCARQHMFMSVIPCVSLLEPTHQLIEDLEIANDRASRAEREGSIASAQSRKQSGGQGSGACLEIQMALATAQLASLCAR